MTVMLFVLCLVALSFLAWGPGLVAAGKVAGLAHGSGNMKVRWAVIGNC